MTVIVVNGYPRSGKDTFTNFCCEKAYPYGKNISTVDFIKDLASSLGWNGEKDEKSRKMLSELKRIFTEWNDLPMKKLDEAIKNHQTDLAFEDFNQYKAIFFVHCREPEEIQKIVDKYNAITVFVDRPINPETTVSNTSDANVTSFKYDYIIKNEGSLKDLENIAKAFLDELYFIHKIPYHYNSNMRKYKCKNTECTKSMEVSCLGCEDYEVEE